MTKKLSAYVIAPFGDKTERLIKVLSEIGVNAFDSYSYKKGDEITRTIVEQIRRADFVVVLLDAHYRSVFFEAGVAVGANKPIAFISEEKSIISPAEFRRSVYLRTSLDDAAILRSFFKRFIKDLKESRGAFSRRSRKKPPKSKRPTTHELHHFLERIRNIRQKGDALRLERIVIELLEKLALTHAREETTPTSIDRGVDAVIWNDALSPSLGNPLLVEVKWGTLDRQRIVQTQKQLEYYLDKTDAKTALLLYLDPSDRRVPFSDIESPRVIPFDVEDFIEELQGHSFEHVVLSARNKLVHGDLT